MRSHTAVGWVRVAELCLLTTLAVASTAATASAAGDSGRVGPAPPRAVALADSLYTAGDHLRSIAMLDSLVSAWRASPGLPPGTPAGRGGTPDLAYALVSRGRQLAHLMAARRAHADLDSALTLAQASGDTLLQCQVLRWHGYAAQSLARTPEAAHHYAQLLTLSRACGSRFYEAFARFGLAYVDLLGGRTGAARAGYTRAIQLFHALEKPREELYVLVSLGILLHQEGDLKAARTCYATIVERCREVDAPQPLLQALNNLALLELEVGDPTLALPAMETALGLAQRLGTIGEIAMIRTNLASALAHLESWSDAVAAYDSALVLVRQNGLVNREASILCHQGDALLELGRRHEANARFQEALGRIAPEERGLAGAAIKGLVGTQEDPGTALELLAQLTARLFPGTSLDEVFQAEQAALLLRLGHPDRSLECARRFRRDAARSGTPQQRLQALVAVAEAYQALAHPDSELVYLQRARELWEEQRSSPRDPRWREERGALARTFYGRLGELLLERPKDAPPAQRTARAFDVLQRFKSRTLLERLRVPRDASTTAGAVAPPPPVERATVTLADLQRHVLRERELLLDLYLGPEASFLFAVTRDSLRAVRLPSADALADICSLTRDVLGTPPDALGAHVDPRVREAALESAARGLLGPVADLLQANTSVLVSPDGCLQGVPLQILVDRVLLDTGAGGPRPREDERMGVSVVPSATLLAELRQREGIDAPGSSLPLLSDSGGSQVLAVGIGLSSTGRDLPGAVAEVRWLAQHFQGVQTHIDTVPPTLDSESLVGHQVLHFATHIEASSARPWNSAIHLGDASGEAHTLAASEVAAARLSARLCVLSGCESAGGRVLWGEGVQSMAAAFLAAGVPAVLATAWPVDDRATQQLMQAFYEQLGRGATVGQAMRGAQQRLASRAQTADPFYWSGLMLIGDGSIRVALQARPRFGLLGALGGARDTALAVGLAALVAALALLWARWIARRRAEARRRPANDAVGAP